jgi:ribonucleoside-diphosphate reductase beta chain
LGIFEQIHSRYTHIIKNIYPNPSEIFDEISRDEEIIKEHQV